MRILISPAKKMNIDTDNLPYENLPQFLPQTQQILAVLKNMDYTALKQLWKCSDKLAKYNFERLQTINVTDNLTPAIFAYEGIQYQYMAPHVFENKHLHYIQEHLRILSGFYGMLRPFDGVLPYRLEMQAKLEIHSYHNLYQFWNHQLATQLASETNLILNLASKEYSKAVLPYLSEDIQVITCLFGEKKDGYIAEKGISCKMARGEMVRFLAENQITCADDITTFQRLNYTFSKEDSTCNTFVFLKQRSESKSAKPEA